MKKITLITVVLLFIQCTQISAQSEYRAALQKGSVLVGGSMAINLGNGKYEYSTQTSKTKINSFNFNPEVGFFASNGFALGLSLDLSTETQKFNQDNNDSKSTSTEYLLGPFIRVYTKSGVFFTGNYSFGKSISEYTYSGSSDREEAKTSKWKLGLGYAAFINENVALEPSISYQAYTLNHDDSDSDFTYRTGQVVIGLGLSIYLRKKSESSVTKSLE
jgi:Outer membrane protein beta-barrel domain